MRAVILALLASLLALPLRAQPEEAAPGPGIEVDLELVLLVDVSRSMTPHELEIQRRGYAEALTSDAVLAAVQSGLLGRVAVTYVEWAGVFAQRTIVDWTLLETRADAEDFAATLSFAPSRSMRRTSISGALDAGTRLFDDNGFSGLRQVIDISGDGPNNEGRPVTQARDAALARGITINGLPLMTREGMGGRWQLDDLDLYYSNCVIGGPGAFVVPVTSWDGFAEAVRRKLVLEMVDAAPGGERGGERLVPVQMRGARPGGYDCMVGERIWRQGREDPFLP